MGQVRIHRGDPALYVKVPNDTARWARLSWAARGYLAEMLTHEPGWDPETQEQAAARAKRERGQAAESAAEVRRIHAQLEREGFRHRLRFHVGGGGRAGGEFINEVHYYTWPALPCEDPGHCATCKTRVSPGHTDPPESPTRCDQGKEHVSPGHTEWKVTDPSVHRGVGNWGGPPENDQPENDHQKGRSLRARPGRAGAREAQPLHPIDDRVAAWIDREISEYQPDQRKAARLAWQLAWQQAGRIHPTTAALWVSEEAPEEFTSSPRAWVMSIHRQPGGLDQVLADWDADHGYHACVSCGAIGWHHDSCAEATP